MPGALASCLYHKFIDSPSRWFPVLGVYYLTNRCRFRCPYCSDGSGRPYHRLDGRSLPADKALAVLGAIRRQCDHVVITGGEPLEHPEADAVMRGVECFRFRSVVFTTNGFALDACLEHLASSVTELVVSLDTLDGRKGDAVYGAGKGVHERILRNIERAAKFHRRRYAVTISSVVTPDGIDDLYQVYEYSRQRGFMFAACPQLVGVKANTDLADSPKYREFYDFLLAEKRKGANIFGTGPYLEHMRDLRKFRCRPFTMLVVSPLGEVFYPCLEQGHRAGNLLEEPDLHDLRRRAAKCFGPQPECDNRCHSACALGFGVGIQHPSAMVMEAWWRAKGSITRMAAKGARRLQGILPI